MRLPNGYGSVYKVEGRRRPWRAVTAAPERKHVGYYDTRKEAVKALSNLVEKDASQTTVAEVYEKWSAEHYPTIQSTSNYKLAYKRIEPIHNRPIAELKLADLEVLLLDEYKESAKFFIKLLLNQMYEYSMKHDIVQKNYATYLQASLPKPKKKKAPFSKDEIQRLFNDDTEIARMVLVDIYSGWRPSELLSFKLEGDLMTGGMKTNAGKNRIVPVHPKIKDFVREYDMEYFDYLPAFQELMKRLGMDHTPHECRHTFITMAKEKELNDDIIKMLVGHARADITENVYTHRTIDSLRRTIAQVDWE